MVCATSLISEKEFSSVIHKNRVGANAPTRSENYSFFGSTPTIDIEPKKQADILSDIRLFGGRGGT